MSASGSREQSDEEYRRRVVGLEELSRLDQEMGLWDMPPLGPDARIRLTEEETEKPD